MQPSASHAGPSYADQWFMSSFDDETPRQSSNGEASRKRRREKDEEVDKLSDDLTKKSSLDVDHENVSWLEKYAPTSRVDLAVHPDKVAQVSKWLANTMRDDSSWEDNRQPVCLLTGPPGSGKTATLRVIADEQDVEIVEFTYSYDEVDKSGLISKEVFNDTGYGDSQIEQFKTFLFGPNLYTKSLLGSKKKKLLVIEDLPNGFYCNPKPYHKAISDIVKRFVDCVPMVFIISSSSSTSSDVSADYRLFPKALRQTMNMCVIPFNPVAITIMTKGLLRIGFYSKIDKKERDEIIATSSGDLRCAFNSLEMKFRHAALEQRPTSSKSKRHATNLTSRVGTSGRDVSTQLFHGLGKICYAKRLGCPPKVREMHREGKVQEDEPRWSAANGCAADNGRAELPPLVEDPSRLIEEMGVSSDRLGLWLHQNYISFAQEIEEAARSVSCLSDADCLGSDSLANGSAAWQREYQSEISARGLLYHLPPTYVGPGVEKQKKRPTGIVEFKKTNASDGVRDQAYPSRSETNRKSDARQRFSFKKPDYFEVTRATNEHAADCREESEKWPLLQSRPTCQELIIDNVPYFSQLRPSNLSSDLCERALNWPDNAHRTYYQMYGSTQFKNFPSTSNCRQSTPSWKTSSSEVVQARMALSEDLELKSSSQIVGIGAEEDVGEYQIEMPQ